MDQIYFEKDESVSIPIRKKLKIRNKMTTKKRQIKATFQDSMKVTLILGQIFSLMPIAGVLSKHSGDVRFSWTFGRIVYWLLSFLGHVFLMFMSVYQLLQLDVDLNSVVPLIYNVIICYTILVYLQIARSWPALVRYIAYTEDLNPNFDNKLVMKFNVTCAVMVMLTLLEQILFYLAFLAKAAVCNNEEINSYEDFLKLLFLSTFNLLPYSPVLGLIVEFLRIQSFFIMDYCDLFVICISYYLTSRLEQINKKLKEAQGKYLPETFWRSAREEYYRATELVRKVDGVISGIIFISFTDDLLSICLQLFNTFQDGFKRSAALSGCSNKNTFFNGYKATTYFLYSLVYVFTKSITVSLTAARINTASVFPATVLYEVPSPVYCVEVERFLNQVYGDKVALSGLQFFSVTRGLLLTVAGTVVTYELVMFQFDLPAAQYNSTELLFPNITTSLKP